ncbi:MAG: hypothetical protein ACYCXW_01930 [Solirubrobacteraceae bacterium]
MKLRVLLSVVVLMGVFAGPAGASFPGRDGLLAVQPVRGGGVILVNSRGARPRRVCIEAFVCSSLRSLTWSPDGRVLAGVSSPREVMLFYSDGSCLNCSIGGSSDPAFTANSSVLTVLSGDHALVQDGIDGIRQTVVLAGRVSDAVWSAQGELAVVRSGRVWVGSPSALRLLATGDSPSWSPDGSRVAIEHGGWLYVTSVRGHSIRRLARGSAPAWSPNGRSLAYIAAHHALRIISLATHRSRRVGRVAGLAVAWQPVPSHSPAGCPVPPGAESYSFPGAVMTSDLGMTGSSAYMGCLTSDGRDRLLEHFGPGGIDDEIGATPAAVGGVYAALVNGTSSWHYGWTQLGVSIYNLQTGNFASGGGGWVSCATFGCEADIDDVVIGAGGVSAAHTISSTAYCSQATCPPVTEEIVASDSRGVRTLDTFTGSEAQGASALTDLRLTGHTLTWLHQGSPESAQLR